MTTQMPDKRKHDNIALRLQFGKTRAQAETDAKAASRMRKWLLIMDLSIVAISLFALLRLRASMPGKSQTVSAPPNSSEPASTALSYKHGNRRMRRRGRLGPVRNYIGE